MTPGPKSGYFRAIALIVLILSMMFTGFPGTQSAAQRAVAVKDITCRSLPWDPYTFVASVWLTGPPEEMTWVTVGSDHPELLWWQSGGLKTVGFSPGNFQIDVSADREEIRHPDVDTAVSVYAELAGERVSCSTVIGHELPPAPVLSAFACEWEYGRESIKCAATLANSSLDLTTTITLTTNHPELFFGLEGSQLEISRGYDRVERSFNLNLSNYPEIDTSVTIFASIERSNTQTSDLFLQGVPRTPTPAVTPNQTPSATPGPARTPTPAPSAEIRSLHTQSGSRSGNLSKVTVCLDRAAPSEGAIITMDNDRPDLFPVPSQVLIPSGLGCRSISVLVASASRPAMVTVTATVRGVSLTSATYVRPARPVLYMQSVSRADGLSKVTLCARSAAPASGLSVPLVSDRPATFPVPPVVLIAPGRACRSLVVAVGAVEIALVVTVTATFDAEVRSGTTTVRRLEDAAGAIAVEPAALTPTSLVLPDASPEPGATAVATSI